MKWEDALTKLYRKRGKYLDRLPARISKAKNKVKGNKKLLERLGDVMNPSFRQIFEHISSQKDINFINISTVIHDFLDPFDNFSVPKWFADWLADTLEKNDQVIVKAAGNYSSNLSETYLSNANKTFDLAIRSLLSYPRLKDRVVIAVNIQYSPKSKIKLNGFPVNKVSYSSYPGELEYLQKATLSAIGHEIIFDKAKYDLVSTKWGSSGTSFSAPLIAGYLALLKRKQDLLLQKQLLLLKNML